MPAPKIADRVADETGGVGFASPAPERRARLVSDITVEHGPVDLLGRFFLKADTAARQRGVTLEFGTFEELLQVNAENQDTWKPITSMYDPRYCPRGLEPERAFCILGRDARGEVVATYASRLFEVDDTDTLYAITTSSRMFYDKPDRTKHADETLRGDRHDRQVDTRQDCAQRWSLVPSDLPQAPSGDDHSAHHACSRLHALEDRSLDGSCHGGAHKGGVIDSAGLSASGMGLAAPPTRPTAVRDAACAWMDAEELLEDLQQFLFRLMRRSMSGSMQRRAQQHG